MNESKIRELALNIGGAHHIDLTPVLPIGKHGFHLEATEKIAPRIKIVFCFQVNLPDWEQMHEAEVQFKISKTFLVARKAAISSIGSWCEKQHD